MKEMKPRSSSLLPSWRLALLWPLGRECPAPQQDDRQGRQLNREASRCIRRSSRRRASCWKQALDLCRPRGLDHHPVAARTRPPGHLVGAERRKIGRSGSTACRSADITLTPGVASPAVQDVFNGRSSP
jgi:hypothetical protein